MLSPEDTRHYAYAFWLGRPYYEQNDNGGENTYYNSPWRRRSSTVSYANVGAGWGR
ncbi:uncharacterized protein LOC143155174 [Ptiloglossa arizonensis]|uniref:uncharacterized protein LOC143155174 n=1 Tax=Ptiloglossa arizonensis TaxID=3350558 RepID=UPI003FA18B02